MDQYFVVSPDGREFGPVDLQGLLQWIREGRVLKATLIRKVGSEPAPAETLPELAVIFSPAAAPPPAIPPFVTAAPLPTEFRSWDFIGKAWGLVKPHWVPLAAIFLILSVLGSIPGVMFVIGGALVVGINRAILGVLAGKPPEIGMLFNGFDRFGQAFLA